MVTSAPVLQHQVPIPGSTTPPPNCRSEVGVRRSTDVSQQALAVSLEDDDAIVGLSDGVALLDTAPESSGGARLHVDNVAQGCLGS